MKIYVDDYEETEFNNWFDKIIAYFWAYVVFILLRLAIFLFGEEMTIFELEKRGMYYSKTGEEEVVGEK